MMLLWRASIYKCLNSGCLIKFSEEITVKARICLVSMSPENRNIEILCLMGRVARTGNQSGFCLSGSSRDWTLRTQDTRQKQKQAAWPVHFHGRVGNE